MGTANEVVAEVVKPLALEEFQKLVFDPNVEDAYSDALAYIRQIEAKLDECHNALNDTLPMLIHEIGSDYNCIQKALRYFAKQVDGGLPITMSIMNEIRALLPDKQPAKHQLRVLEVRSDLMDYWDALLDSELTEDEVQWIKDKAAILAATKTKDY